MVSIIEIRRSLVVSIHLAPEQHSVILTVQQRFREVRLFFFFPDFLLFTLKLVAGGYIIIVGQAG